MAERPTHPAIEKLRERRERHVQRGLLYRIGVALAGVLLILGGILLSLPGVPGPGLVVVAIGLGLLALEWDPAERLLERILDKLEDAKDASRPAQVALVAGAAVLAVGAFAVTAIFFDVPLLPF
jgi:archaellum biogenesis protein FlaJ (TadC family)